MQSYYWELACISRTSQKSSKSSSADFCDWGLLGPGTDARTGEGLSEGPGIGPLCPCVPLVCHSHASPLYFHAIAASGTFPVQQLVWKSFTDILGNHIKYTAQWMKGSQSLRGAVHYLMPGRTLSQKVVSQAFPDQNRLLVVLFMTFRWECCFRPVSIQSARCSHCHWPLWS